MCSSDWSDLEEEDDQAYLEEEGSIEAAADFATGDDRAYLEEEEGGLDDLDHTQPLSDEQYATACGEMAALPRWCVHPYKKICLH